MVDGAASLMAFFSGGTASGLISLERGRNLLDGGAPNYRCYECADGRYVAVGALEPKFFAILLQRLGIEARRDTDWASSARALAEVFKQRTRDEWAAFFEGTDACVAPVLTLDEAPAHPHSARAASISKWTGSSSLLRHRVSRARRAPCSAPRRNPMKAGAKPCSAGGYGAGA